MINMTLSFSTIWPNKRDNLAGQPNFFIKKIWAGIPEYDFKDRDHEYYAEQYKDMKGEYWHGYIEGINAIKGGMSTPFLPKKHTIGTDNKNRSVVGKDIHYVINNRTKKRFQFLPVIP